MEQTFRAGQIIWVNNWAYLFSSPSKGDVIVFQHQKKDLVKRVWKVGSSVVEVRGDNRADSLPVRLVDRRQIKGKVFRPNGANK